MFKYSTISGPVAIAGLAIMLALGACSSGGDAPKTTDNGDMMPDPDRTVVQSEGFWGGSLSNRQDADGNPRLVVGFNAAEFEESDGSAGSFVGAFLALSERLRASGG